MSPEPRRLAPEHRRIQTLLKGGLTGAAWFATALLSPASVTSQQVSSVHVLEDQTAQAQLYSVVVERSLVSLFFAQGEDELPRGVDLVLADTIQAGRAGTRIRVVGYHDASGLHTQNVDLAQRRAQAVKYWLVASGVDARLVALDIASPGPDTPEFDAESRRVDIQVLAPERR